VRRKPVVRHPGVALTLRRHPRWRTAAAVALGLVSGGAVTVTMQEAQEARASWGRSVTVLVASRDLEAGEQVDLSTTRRAEHPAPLVPDGALTTLPADGRVAVAIFEGEVLREERLAPRGASELGARLPPGTRGMAIPVEPGTTPPLAVGDRVEVLVALPAESAGGGPPGFSLATGVLVVEVTDVAVTLAVDPHVAPRLAAAFGLGAVTLALVG